MKSIHKTDKWGSGLVHERQYLTNENINGGELLVKIDMRFGMPQISVYTNVMQPRRFPEFFLKNMQLWLELEGITSSFHSEKIVEQVKKDIQKLRK